MDPLALRLRVKLLLRSEQNRSLFLLEQQRKGFSSMALREAERLIFDEMNAAMGSLLCLPPLEPFYRKERWQAIHSSLEIEQPTGSGIWPGCAMLLPKPGMQFAPKTFHLGGLPF